MAGKRNPQADIMLWVDSQRLTDRQLAYLQQRLENGLPNVYVRDLRDIPEYGSEKLFNIPETNPHWRDLNKKSIIWRQVDAAKILICLQGNYDQTFFADMDRSHLDIKSQEVQRMLKKHGLLIGSGYFVSYFVENQLWGFNASRRPFFQEYYHDALKIAYEGNNAWNCLLEKIENDLIKKEKKVKSEILFLIEPDGSAAEQPGHEWFNGLGHSARPDVRTIDAMTGTFNKRSVVQRNINIGRDAEDSHSSSREKLLSGAWMKTQVRALEKNAKTIMSELYRVTRKWH